MNHDLSWNKEVFTSPKLKSLQFTPRQVKRNNEDQLYTDKFLYNKSPRLLNSRAIMLSPTPFVHARQRQQGGVDSLFQDCHLGLLYSNCQVPIQQELQISKKIIWDEEEENADQYQDEAQKLCDSKEDYHPQNYSGKKSTPMTRKSQEVFLTTPKKCAQNAWDCKKSRPKQKGLRKLSSRAYQIVIQMKSATYKEVATKLVDQLYQESSLDGEVRNILDQGKDQQNIKRRVYDALNVLIALGILRKQGRKIVGQKRNKKKASGMNSTQQFSIIQEKLNKSHQINQSKRQKLQQLKKKYKTIGNLINRNKALQQSEDQVIRFPFIGTIINEFKDENIKFTGDVFSLKSTKRFKPFGDVDSLNFLYHDLLPKDQ